MLFGEYSIINDSEEIIIPEGYSRIELLEEDSLFVLWNNKKAVIANLSNDKTDSEYDSVKSIGNGYYVVSKTILKKVRVRKTGYGYYGNPYTYHVTTNVPEKRFGVIDRNLKNVVPYKYLSLSGFNEEQNLTTVNTKGKQGTISLKQLQEKSTKVILIKGTEYTVIVKSLIPIGIVIRIQDSTYIIHKKYLYKEKKSFTKGELVNATFLGVDEYDHPIWRTKEYQQKEE